MSTVYISEDLAPRYSELLNDDADVFSIALVDAYKSPTIMDRTNFRFKIYKQQAKVFEDLFTQTYAAPVSNAGEYNAFRSQLRKHVALIDKALNQRYFSKNVVLELRQSADQLGSYYCALKDKIGKIHS